LTTFESSIIFGGSWSSVENWLEPKTETPSGNLACPNPRNTLCQHRKIIDSFISFFHSLHLNFTFANLIALSSVLALQDIRLFMFFFETKQTTKIFGVRPFLVYKLFLTKTLISKNAFSQKIKSFVCAFFIVLI